MKRFFVNNCLWLLLGWSLLTQPMWAQVTTGNEEHLFSREEVITDIQFLEKELFRRHPGLFTYTDSLTFFQFSESLKAGIPPQMHERDMYSMVSTFSQIIRDGHTLFFPAQETTSAYNAFELFFPFRVCWDGEKLFTVMHFTDSVTIPDGAQILSINGLSASHIIQFCLDRMMHDGHNTTYPIWVLNNWFSEYYGYFFGHPSIHTIRFKDADGHIKEVLVEGVPKPEMAVIRPLRYPKNDLDKQAGEGITLSFRDHNKVAVLTIRDFSNRMLRNKYNQNFRPAIYNAFAEINESGAQKLILDLRDNQGGEVRNGLILLRFVLCEPFRVVDYYRKVDDPSAPFDRRLKNKVGGAFTGERHPVSRNHFDGELMVLVNGGSFSNSGIVASAISKHKRGLITGEETGGNGVILCGSIREIKLPNSGIIVEVPTLQFVINGDLENTGRGIQPDLTIRPRIVDKLSGADPELNAAVKWLQD